MTFRDFRVWLCLMCGISTIVGFSEIALGKLSLQQSGLSESFESPTAGTFQGLDSVLGHWKVVAGSALIDDQHARSGSKCLHLNGSNATIELELAGSLPSASALVFEAERWTSRGPFGFRIDARSDGEWVEIFNGDTEIRVGRAFLSKVRVQLDDQNIKSIRFRVESPRDAGVLIDDIRLIRQEKQRIVSTEVIPLTLPVLLGAQASALLKLKIETTGTMEPISLTGLSAIIDASAGLSDITSVQVFSTGVNSRFRLEKTFGGLQKPLHSMMFEGEAVLGEGENYFWVACSLDSSADIDQFVSARCEKLVFSDGNSLEINSTESIQRRGVKVRSGGDDGVHTYRIPGLATTNQGTLIAVYDMRWRGGGDLPGDIDVGMSRSVDGGRTWDPMKVIMDMGDDEAFAFDGIGDPSVLVDNVTGCIWCAATWSHGNRAWTGSGPGLEAIETGQLILVKSEDDGVTWSKPVNITSQVKKPEWCFLLQGPGKGITTQDGTIVFPAQYQDPADTRDTIAHRLPHSAIIYSHDHGHSWQISTGVYDDTTEAQLVELAEGQIMINCRYNRENKRIVMTTENFGQTWSEHPTSRRALVEPGACMASLINVGRELRSLGFRGGFAEGSNFLLFSNPDSTTERNRLTIKASMDGGLNWLPEHQLLLDEQSSAGYSCMSMIDAETVGILYEGSQAHMTFQRVKISDILKVPTNQRTSNSEH